MFTKAVLRKHFFAFALISLPHLAHSADLLEVLDLALENDANLRAARISTDASQLLPDIAKTYAYPSLSLSASEIKERKPMSRFRGTEGEVTVRQPLWNAVVGAGLEVAEAQAGVARLYLRRAEQGLYARVAESYFRVLAAEDNLKTVDSEVKATEEFRDLAFDRFDAKLGTLLDLNDAEARFSQVKAARIQADHETVSSKVALTEITNTEIGKLNALAEDANISNPNPNDLNWWLETALQNNLEIAIATAEVEQALANIDVERSLGQIRFDLVASHNKSLSGDHLRSNRDFVSVVASYPVFQGGLVQKRTMQAAIQHESSLEALEAVKRSVTSQTSSAFLDIIRSVNQVKALQDALVASESSLKAREEGYNAGIFTTLDVLNAQRDKFTVERNLNQAKYSHFLSIVRLESLAGTLDRADFEALNESLN